MPVRRFALVLIAALLTGCIDDDESPTDPSANAPRLTSLTVSVPAGTTIFLGSSSQMSVSARDQFGNPFPGASFSWSSNAPGIASVSQTGNVVGSAVGAATIQVTATDAGESVSSSIPVVVSADAPVLTTVLTATPRTTLVVTESAQLVASFRDQYNRNIPATVVWTSSAPNVASVDANGVVTALSPGEVHITASATAAGAAASSTIRLVVTSINGLTTIVITPPSPVSLLVGQSVQLSASPRDALNNPIIAPVTWASTNPAIATVTSTGFVTAKALGDVYIAATAQTPTAVVTSDALIRVVIPFPTTAGVTATIFDTFSPTTVDIAKGGTVSWSFATPSDVVFAPTPGAPANIPVSIGGPVSRQFNTAGTFTYSSTVKPSMTGTVIVH